MLALKFTTLKTTKIMAFYATLVVISIAILMTFPQLVLSQTKEAQPLAVDPVMEARVMEIAKDLRCLVCQNETIAGSHADLAIDLRHQIQDLLEAGKSRSEIMQYMVDRYGDFVLYKPPFKSSTLVLWGGPFLLMLLGLWALRNFVKKQTALKKVDNSSTLDLSQARALLESKDFLKKDTE